VARRCLPYAGTTEGEITGGTFKLWTTVKGASSLVTGAFSGGTITQIPGFSGCTNQQYEILGTLESVGTAGGALVGSGEFSAVLTHHRALIFGACRTYFATVTGTVDLEF
jgi:hypothetical protein